MVAVAAGDASRIAMPPGNETSQRVPCCPVLLQLLQASTARLPPHPLPTPPLALPAEEHRELVRRCLRTVLNAGYSPMSFFAKDYAKYFYLAELLSLVDLSLVRRREGGVGGGVL